MRRKGKLNGINFVLNFGAFDLVYLYKKHTLYRLWSLMQIVSYFIIKLFKNSSTMFYSNSSCYIWIKILKKNNLHLIILMFQLFKRTIYKEDFNILK